MKKIRHHETSNLKKNYLKPIPQLKVGQDIKIQIGTKDKRRNDPIRFIEGKVDGIYTNHFIVQTKEYKESISFVDFKLGRASIIN